MKDETLEFVPEGFQDAWQRLRKDLALLGRDAVGVRLELLPGDMIKFIKEKEVLEIPLKYYPYNSNGDSLDRIYEFDILITVTDHYPI